MRLFAYCLVGVVTLVGCSTSSSRTDATQDSHAAQVVLAGRVADSTGLRERLARIDTAIETQRQQLGVPGAAVALVTADRALLIQGFGYRDREHELPVTPTTRFLIGSCTKPFTAIAVMIAADEGLLSLDDSPRRFLPYFHLRDPVADARVTLRDLLSHRTGVPDDLGGGWYERYGTTERLIQVAMRSQPRGPFRQVFHYNNYLYSAAGLSVASARHTTYDSVIVRTIFEPLGMRSSGLSLEAVEASDDFSYGYEDSARTRVPPTRLVYLPAIAPAGNISSNAEDMARWARMLVGGGELDGRRIVSDSGFRAMLTPAVRTSSGGQYALGWFIEDWHGLRLYSHPGGVTGFGTRCELLPDQRLGWIILTNVDDQVLPKAIREIVYTNLLR
jgi:CubicO group peptidase (beta-lactamase class C family)